MANEHPVKIKTTLAEEDLLFRTMEGTEELGRPFLYNLELLSPQEDLALEDILGQEACVTLEVQGGAARYFHGYVTQFSQTGRRGNYATYHMELRPWLWFLTRTADCRIFQGKTVPEIITAVFREHGFSDFKDSLSASYRTWEYCVQYRETDFNFVSRLMEQEGIYYYFIHEDGKHTLVLSDSHGAHSPLDNGYSDIPYYPPSQTVREEHVYDWTLQKSVRSGKYVLRAYDFRKPKANLEVNSVISREHAQAEYEVFDYPGPYFERGEGDTYAKVRIEELQSDYERAHGVSDARGVCAGGLFTLSEHPRQDQNREYLIVSAHQSISLGDYESSGAEPMQFKCVFTAMDGSTPYRVPRLTPKPAVQGPQTAITVGPDGEEIWTDKFGRIKVQFHWDRYGKADENSSCWVRVAQIWAGANWGGMHIPRIGQEVIVDFIEGDPDRPIVTGRVYNADNMPPYGLPDNKTQSGIKSRSSKDGTGDNFNEIRFEDLKGSEEFYVHAEKDMNRVVENNDTVKVGFASADEGDLSPLGSGSQSVQIRNNRSEKVGNDETITIGRDRVETVGRDESISIGRNRNESVAKDEAVTISGKRSLDVGETETISIGESRTEEVGKNESITIGENRDESVGGTEAVSVGKDRSVEIGGNDVLNVGKGLVIEVTDQITLKTGSASIVLKKDGKITIKGKDIALEASGEIKAKASKDVTIKGSTIKQN
jgi:type VI secretion system secreted protein VgrG